VCRAQSEKGQPAGTQRGSNGLYLATAGIEL
jgi:hypothetical protein